MKLAGMRRLWWFRLGVEIKKKKETCVGISALSGQPPKLLAES